jgi:hypothetical protein
MKITLTHPIAIATRLLGRESVGRNARLKAVGNIRLNGVMGPARQDQRLSFIPDQAASQKLKADAPIHVTVYDCDESMAFYTSIDHITASGHLLLRFPSSIQVQNHRQEVRQTIERHECVRIGFTDGQRSLSFQVVDISNQGLSFRFRSRELVMTRGDKLTARLTAPGLTAYITNISVRFVRKDRRLQDGWIAGAQVIHPPPELMAWLRQAERLVPAA